ncbi:MAG TPA: amidohydrolase family protein [Gemmatimonadaceae bacterium]|nr:amidohydrolase family protein [Gemmatimonadaceae bacterium]
MTPINSLRALALRRIATAGRYGIALAISALTLQAQTPAAPAAQSPGALDPLALPAPSAGTLVAITNANIMTASHGNIMGGTILIRNGKIAEIGANVTVPAGAKVIDGRGKWVTPGIIDAHSHTANEGINEGSQSVTAEVRMEDVLRQDGISLYRHLAGGTTTVNILHGSANTIGGQNAVIKLRFGLPVDSLRYEHSVPGIKFALGENVRRTGNATSTRYPRSRQGVEDLLRESFIGAQEYKREWDAYNTTKAAWDKANARSRGAAPIPPRRDLEKDALVEVMEGKRLVYWHSYRADEILMALRVAKEFGFKPHFTHILEGYKLADELAAAGATASTFADMWGYKLEAWDAIPHNAALMAERGVVTTINSDSDERARRLYQEAAKAMRFGGASEEAALRMITLNAAVQLGIDKHTGSIDVGKDADIAIFNGHPFAPASRVEMTMIDGRVFFDRSTAPTLEWLMQLMRNRPKVTSEDGGAR